jgi:hypothetical protein
MLNRPRLHKYSMIVNRVMRIGASDQQHGSHRCEQHPKRTAELRLNHLSYLRIDRYADSLIRIRVQGSNARSNRSHFVAGVPQSGRRAQGEQWQKASDHCVSHSLV